MNPTDELKNLYYKSNKSIRFSSASAINADRIKTDFICSNFAAHETHLVVFENFITNDYVFVYIKYIFDEADTIIFKTKNFKDFLDFLNQEGWMIQ